MNYIQELTKQLELLSKGKKVKINIHYILSEPLNSFCISFNQDMAKENKTLINMGKQSIIMPHISLVSGYVDNYNMLDKILEIVDEYVKKQEKFIVNPTSMYFKSISEDSPEFLFIDFLENDYLGSKKRELYNLLNEYIYPLKWDMSKERPHVTVGCYNKVTDKARKKIDRYYAIPQCKIYQMGVSLSGRRGVCLGNLKTFDLR